jgi:hypothetical protein
MLPGSLTPAVLNLTNSSNIGLNGRWMFRVDGKNITLPEIPPIPGMITMFCMIVAGLSRSPKLIARSSLSKFTSTD